MPPKSAKSTPTKPKPKAAQHSRAVVKNKGARAAVNMYLLAYNALSAAGWAYVLARLISHMAAGGAGGASGKQGFENMLVARGSTGFADFGQVTKWVQTAALLELVHAGLGLVRSSLGTTLAQVSSRIFIVWYICEQYNLVPATPFYISMCFAWSFTEVVRYSFYAANLVGVKVEVLEWLRYSTFYVLYPLGAASEAALVYYSAPWAAAAYGAPGYFLTYVILAIWPPALAVMMLHMHSQRRKHVKASRKSVMQAKIEAASAESSAINTPARSTRSRSSKPQVANS